MSLINKIKLLFRFIKYKFTSVTIYKIHSPFVFKLCEDILHNDTSFYDHTLIESLRTILLADNNKINVSDYGAGSLINNKRSRKIKKITAYAQSPKYAGLLSRIVYYFKPSSIIELGTSVGISAMYLATPCKTVPVYSIEGCPETAALANKNIEKLKYKNIHIINGTFDDVLPQILTKTSNPSLIFFDGNHRKDPTLKYFNTCLKHIDNESIMIFDDIHWSDEMEQAWNEIKNHPDVTVSIDLFHLGLVFFKKELSKQNFIIRF
ncbi:MAG: class I SAM-dependent methyltransferase [Bacteroidota bacterium]|nr:class I SAM-dependent methyltransferase [Bacteroidota bacterium]